MQGIPHSLTSLDWRWRYDGSGNGTNVFRCSLEEATRTSALVGFIVGGSVFPIIYAKL